MVYYVSFYAPEGNAENRKMVLSATNKMRYILSIFSRNKVYTNIVSCSWTENRRGYKGSVESLDEYTEFKQFKTFGRRNIFTRLADIFGIKLRLFFYLLKNVKKSDTVLVYHSLYYCNVIKLIHFDLLF